MFHKEYDIKGMSEKCVPRKMTLISNTRREHAAN